MELTNTYSGLIDDWKIELIDQCAWRRGFRWDELPEVRQEIALDIHQFQYDPSHGASERTALTTLIHQRLSHLIRTRTRRRDNEVPCAEFVEEEGTVDDSAEAVSAVGLNAESYIVAQVLERSDARTLAMLDLDREALKALRDPPPALDPVLIHELHRYAQDRISDGSCNELLRRLEMAHPDLVHRFGLGYLPTDYQQALSRPARWALLGRRLGGCVVLPAFDVDGQVVDLLAVNTESRRYSGLWDEPRGLLGGRGHDLPHEVIITDTLPWLGRLLQQGYQQVLMVRDPVDARSNAQRLHAAGVRIAHVRSHRQGDGIAEALAAGGIKAQVDKRLVTGDEWITTASRAAVENKPEPQAAPEPELAPEPEQPTPAPEPVEPEPSPNPSPKAAEDGMTVLLVEFDLDQNLAIFEVGPIRYAIEVAEEDLPSRQVVARRGQACHQDRINLGVAKQCQRYAGSAARRLETEPVRIAAHLADAWKQIQARESDARLAPAVPIDGDDRAQAEALLRDPQLLQHITDDLTAMGWIGEDTTKGLLYLAAVSRLLPDPLWTVYRAASGAAPWRSLGIVAALIPPEETVVFHRLTEAVLRRTDPRSLRHRLLLVDRAETLRPEGAVMDALQQLVQRTMAENEDLDELSRKNITWHSLRVSFATLLFANGCPIRSVNELMLHRCLSTTARYTPIPIEDMHQVWRSAHPRP